MGKRVKGWETRLRVPGPLKTVLLTESFGGYSITPKTAPAHWLASASDLGAGRGESWRAPSGLDSALLWDVERPTAVVWTALVTRYNGTWETCFARMPGRFSHSGNPITPSILICFPPISVANMWEAG